jgi:iron complex outermembrane receptor protein
MTRYHRLFLGASVAPLVLIHCGSAQAQEAESGPSIIVTGQRGTALTQDASTSSRLGISPLETPATINTIDGEAIRARGDFDFVDAVTRAPGVTTAATPGNGGSALVVRGFAGQGSVMHLYKGVRLVPNNSSITFPFDTWNVERIEVLNGPASVLYGQGALGGVVNVVPKAPNFERFEAQARAGYGSFNTIQLAAGAAGPISEIIAFRADASFRRSDGYVDRGQSRSLALSGALEFHPSADFGLTLRHDYGHNKPMRYSGTPLADGTRLDTSMRERNYDYADSVIDYRDNRTQLNLEWRPAEGLEIRSTAYLLDSFRRWQTLEAYYFDTQANVVRRSTNTGIVHDVQQIGNQTSLAYSAALGGNITNRLVVGFDVNHIKLDYSHNFADIYEDAVNPQTFNPGSFLNTVGVKPRYKTRTDIFALFLEDRLELSDKVSVIAGMRYESDRVGRWNFVYDAAGQNITGETPALNGGRDAHKKFQDFTWRLGAVYQPSETLSFFGQYVTGVDPVGNLTSFTTSGAQYAFSNAKGYQIEAGVKSVFLGGKGAATLSVYRLVKNDLSVQRVINGPIQQVGQQSGQGVEASFALQLPGGFAIDANGTVLDAKYDDFPSGAVDYSGLTPPNVPEVAANATLSWSPAKRFGLNATLRYVGRRFMDQANLKEMPGYFLVDVGASLNLTSHVVVDLRAYNLFDKDYALSSNYDSQWILGRPRSIEIALRAGF